MQRYRNHEKCKEIQRWQRSCNSFDKVGKGTCLGKFEILVQLENIVH